MEWVETTAKTVDEAKDSALDQLGIDESEAEFEVIEEPKPGLFGRLRGEARVRARIQPSQPRPKVERRDRKRSKPKGANGADRQSTPSEGGSKKKTSAERPNRAKAGSSKSKQTAGDRSSTSERTPSMQGEEVTVQGQAEIIVPFLEGLMEAFGLEGSIEEEQIDDDTIELQVSGEDLGLLIGPKGQTLSALQDLSRTVVQRRVRGGIGGRVRLDVSGYRQRRREALARFATGVASEVKDSATAKALEPMNAADRKVVHDTVNEIDGVSTVSEGEDARRHVVIVPDGD